MIRKRLEDERNQNRFDFVSDQHIGGTDFIVLVDRATGVNYVAASFGMDGGTRITPLLDRDGKPYVDPRYGGK